MKIKYRQPLLWPVMRLFFKVDFQKIGAFTFGDTIYAPRILPNHLLQHEMVHIKYQRSSKVVGFFMVAAYILNKKFRLKMEIPAYRAQVKAGYSIFLAAKNLSSDFYGNLVSYEEAICLLSV